MCARWRNGKSFAHDQAAVLADSYDLSDSQLSRGQTQQRGTRLGVQLRSMIDWRQNGRRRIYYIEGG